MTYEEAFEWFKNDLKDGKCREDCPDCNAREKTIEALEKQIPKKPKMTLHNGYCGNCGIGWGYDRLKTEEYCGFKYFQYCPICGQAIDWSEEE